MKQFSIVSIGGMNLDRKYYAKASLQYETSNPVSSSYSVGGVARNIAENLGRLGNKSILLSVSGQDGDWKIIEESSESYINLSYVEQRSGLATGSYTAILDEEGNLALALADMDVFDHIKPDLLQKHEEILLQADCLVIDLNCPKEAVQFTLDFARENGIPLAIIPVSSPKMDRLPSSLDGLTWLIVNRDETETFFQRSIETKEDWQEATMRWLELGIQNVIVTKGSEGVMAGSRAGGPIYFPAVPTPKVLDVTGAGDSFCSAIIHMWLRDYSFSETIHAGLMNAHRTIMSEDTVRQDLNEEDLLQDIREMNL